MSNRINIIDYGMALAKTAALRSEDPFRQVGAAAFNKENRVIGLSYNGLPSGFNPDEHFWEDRDARQKFLIHAEQNLCSLFKRGEVATVFCTTMPCDACMKLLIAHSVQKIYFHEDYPGSNSPELAKTFGISLIQV